MPTPIAPPTYDVSSYAVIFIAVLGTAVIGGMLFWIFTRIYR